jgi:hypothetical protein
LQEIGYYPLELQRISVRPIYRRSSVFQGREFMSMSRFTILGVLLLVGLCACSDDSTNPIPTPLGAVSGIVYEFETGLPLADASVVLIGNDFTVYAAKRVGDDGFFSFTGLESGAMLLYAFKADTRMAEPFVSRIDLAPGQKWLGAVTMMSDPSMLLDHRIHGRVTDAATGDPIGGVWIAPIGLGEAGNSIRYLTENTGTTLTVSDQDGNYSLPVYGVPENGDGPVIGLTPISCGRSGYRPRTFAGEGPDFAYENYLPGGLLPAPADSTLELDIVLVPVSAGEPAAGETGFVTGRIVNDGLPQAGVMVSVALMALADRDTVFAPPEKVAVDGGFVLSGADGTFSFELEPGFYSLLAGALPDDGWCRYGGPPHLEVVADQINAVGDIGVHEAIAPISPAPGAAVTGTPGFLSWTAIEGTTNYRIRTEFTPLNSAAKSKPVSTVKEAMGTETEWAWSYPPIEDGAKYLVHWYVYAENTIEGEPTQIFSWFEIPATFTLTGEAP